MNPATVLSYSVSWIFRDVLMRIPLTTSITKLKMVNWSCLAYAPTRYQFWFLGTPYLDHFIEQCVVQYPSPLENDAPFRSKAILLAVAGSIEFLLYAAIAELCALWGWIIASCIKWALRFDNPRKSGTNTVFREMTFQILMLAAFWFRSRTFVHTIRRKCPDASIKRAPRLLLLISTFIWFNPALIYYGFATLISQLFTGSTSMRIQVMRVFWTLMAPSMDIEAYFGILSKDVPNLSAEERTREAKSKLSLTWITMESFKVVFLEAVITQIPRIMITITQFAQNQNGSRGRNERADSKRQGNLTASLHLSTSVARALSTFENGLQASFSFLWCRMAPVYVYMVRYYKSNTVTQTPEWDIKIKSPCTAVQLLHIKPGFADEPIECMLEWYDLASLSSVPYTAISYAWGTDNLTNDIVVDNKRVSITKSAYAVLAAMRSYSSPKTIWIDAICINQTREVEKKRQIPLMTVIYESSNEVMVWLGPSVNAHLATGSVERLFLNQKLIRLTATKTLTEISSSAAETLRQMLDQPWFSRAWVVQEVVRGQGKVTVRYGNESVAWDKLSWFIQALQRNEEILNMINSKTKGSELNATSLQNVETINRCSHLISKIEPMSLLFYLTQMFRAHGRFNAKVSHDRVYALLGLSGSAGAGEFGVDYSKSNRQLCIDVAHHLARNGLLENRLDFLMHAGKGFGRSDGLPSWAPDWSLTPNTLPIVGSEGAYELLNSPLAKRLVDSAARFASDGQLQFIPGEPTNLEVATNSTTVVKDAMTKALFHATRGSMPQSFEFENDFLIAQGQIVDEIIGVGRECPKLVNKNYLDGIFDVFREWSVLIAGFESSVYTEPRERIAAYMRMLLHDHPQQIDFTFSAVGRADGEIGELELKGAASVFLLTLVPKKLKEESMQSDPAMRAIFEKLMAIWRSTCCGRVFAITKKGYMGLFLPGTKKGDLVTVVHGVKLPLSMRRLPDDAPKALPQEDRPTYQLIGQAYVHGLMDGAALDVGAAHEMLYIT
jgi:hypothetical protein